MSLSESRINRDQFKWRALVAEAKADSDHISNDGKALKISAFVMNSTWIIDSGATKHMTCDFRLVQTLKPSTNTIVSVANGNVVPIIGEGDVSLSDTLNLDSEIRTRKTIGYGIRGESSTT
ncbi:hypothetical protein ACFX1X_028761 [Malus domestica]